MKKNSQSALVCCNDDSSKKSELLSKYISFIYILSYTYEVNKNVLSGRILEGTTIKIREKITCRKGIFYYWLRNAAHSPQGACIIRDEYILFFA